MEQGSEAMILQIKLLFKQINFMWIQWQHRSPTWSQVGCFTFLKQTSYYQAKDNDREDKGKLDWNSK